MEEVKMDKWADYCISAVRYNSTGAHIEKVKVHVDNGDSIGAASEWFRTDVILALEKGNSFVTITKNEGKWNKGQDVHIIHVNGKKYIRTDTDSTASDNLENLPRF